jgi:tripartite-type tricarboxylate transporter receptor subunit TctC
VIGTAGTHAQSQYLYKSPPYQSSDFAPVAMIADQPFVLITRKDPPAASLQEFIKYAKANQQSLKYGSPGTGSAGHLACALLNSAIGVDITHVPYRGAAQAMTDLISGVIDYQCAVVAVVLS